MFWRDSKLTDEEALLVNEIDQAHLRSTYRPNPSSTAVQICAKSGADFPKAVSAALMTLGQVHAPLRATMSLLKEENPLAAIDLLLASDLKVSGWGSSFTKGSPDPLWMPVDNALQAFPEMYETIEEITAYLHSRGKNIFPNPSCYTAAANIIIGVPIEIAELMFIQFRLANWSNIFYSNLT